jgi:Trypsin-co-occurring domain 2
MKTPEPNSLFVKDLIRRVHQELLESQRERQECQDAPIFEVEKLTIEVNFVVMHSTTGHAGLDFKIITIGGAGVGANVEYQQQQVHKITLSLVGVPGRSVLPLPDVEDSGSRFMPRKD